MLTYWFSDRPSPPNPGLCLWEGSDRGAALPACRRRRDGRTSERARAVGQIGSSRRRRREPRTTTNFRSPPARARPRRLSDGDSFDHPLSPPPPASLRGEKECSDKKGETGRRESREKEAMGRGNFGIRRGKKEEGVKGWGRGEFHRCVQGFVRLPALRVNGRNKIKFGD